MHGLPAEFITFAVSDPWFDARSGQPGDKAAAIVIPSQRALSKRGTSKFRGPNHEGILEEAALFEVAQQGRDGLVYAGRDGAEFRLNVAVVVPIVDRSLGTAPDLDKPCAPLNQTAGQQTASAKVVRDCLPHAVGGAGGFRFGREIEGLRRAELHFGGQLG